MERLKKEQLRKENDKKYDKNTVKKDMTAQENIY